MQILEIINQGETLDGQHLEKLLGGNTSMKNNTNGAIFGCSCTGNDNSNKGLFCKCKDKEDEQEPEEPIEPEEPEEPEPFFI